MESFRTKVLTMLGGSRLVRRWAALRCDGTGVRIRGHKDSVVLQKGDFRLRILPKHIFYAPQICRSFESFAEVLVAEEQEGIKEVDFTAEPNALNWARMCLAFGAVLSRRDGNIWLRKEKRVMILAPNHFVYCVDMASKFDLYFSGLVPTERDGMSIVDFSRPGIVQRYARSGLEFEMASFPEEEEAIEEYLRWYRPKSGDLVFDMGAHCGVSTYHLSKLVGPQGSVISFEPDPGNFSILQRNIARHQLTNVIALNAAVAGVSGKLAFNAEGTIGSSLTSLLQRESVGSMVMVDAITLEAAFERWGTPIFCKIDIEGAELEVIGGSGDLLRHSGTHFAIDTNHPQPNGKMTDKEIEAMFRSYGYESESEAKPLLTTWARPKR